MFPYLIKRRKDMPGRLAGKSGRMHIDLNRGIACEILSAAYE